jgi:methylmalonyl-CoA mutase C-terminal domain/subunit
MMKQPLRVVVAKPGLDGHDRGAKIIARAPDAGMEVIYTGIFQTSEMITRPWSKRMRTSGLSILSGAHLHFAEEICRCFASTPRKDVSC